MRLRFVKCHGSGNDFPLIDARDGAVAESDWPGIAQALSDRAGPVGGDGILLLAPARGGADIGFRMFNADGSEAETCLNGLRCVARAGFEALGIEVATVSLAQSGARVAHVADIVDGVYGVETVAGPASIAPGDVGIRIAEPVVDAIVPGLPTDRRVTGVAMPNPHLIAFVEAVDVAELVALGQWCEADRDLLVDRANVSFVEVRGTDLFVRTHERGVGLTNACGSAMAASVHAAGLTGRVPFGTWTTVFNPGGRVRAMASGPDAGATVTIQGNATFEWDGEVTVDPVSETASDLVVFRRRDAEVVAWEKVIVGV